MLQGLTVADNILSFHSMIQNAENSIYNPQGGFDRKTKTWKPHKSPEGGNDTVAYGHKLTDEEQKNGYVVIENQKVLFDQLTNDLAKKLYMQDWENHTNTARKWFGVDWNKLNAGQQLIATELVFNMGNKVTTGKTEYLQFKQKLLANDPTFIDQINRTYTDTTGNKRSLTERTDPIKNWYKEYNLQNQYAKEQKINLSTAETISKEYNLYG